MYTRLLLAAWLTIGVSLSCKRSSGDDNGGTNPPPLHAGFAKGADISWLTEMETAGRKFYTATGTETECMTLLKSLGINSIRLRVWVNPAGGWNNKADVLAKALRAKALGLRVMINFHYSDSWADPGQQNKPAAWTALDATALGTAVYDHTVDVLQTLKTNGIVPEWVQVGNETNDGMLWPTGKASVSMAAFAALFNRGYDAVKAVDPSIKVIAHISNGQDNGLFRWLLDGLRANGGRWDITGMSLYPEPGNWSSINSQCLTNMQDMLSRYSKPVMICEVGMSWDQAAACQSFLADLIQKVNGVSGNNGLGVFYWEPQCYGGWKGYTKGAFSNNGTPTIALNAFK